jgi:hypothetical protein
MKQFIYNSTINKGQQQLDRVIKNYGDQPIILEKYRATNQNPNRQNDPIGVEITKGFGGHTTTINFDIFHGTSPIPTSDNYPDKIEGDINPNIILEKEDICVLVDNLTNGTVVIDYKIPC